LVIAGVGLHFGIHLVINVGVSTGLWPTTGLPLPMVSFGGSSMAVSGLAVGLALAVGARPGPVFSSRAFEG
jgi:cell division protein FtsW (lipid II flippase)